ncbi:MAG: hypothetical protein QOE33_3057 [Acidobacteriota bacterium]|jgi:uncharacterized membrane protein (DUF2068 family)|nr:hypothetical protein [Acidobacteriota bacterium]
MKRKREGHAKQKRDRWLLLIAAFKLFKGLLLLIVGIGALSLIHKDAAAHVARWTAALRVDPDNRFIHGLLGKLSFASDRQLEELGAGTFFYAALLLTEGVGLWLQKHWAEYFTIFVTGSLIPLEVYELCERFTATKVVVLLINIAVVVYLIARLFNRPKRDASIIVSMTKDAK